MEKIIVLHILNFKELYLYFTFTGTRKLLCLKDSWGSIICLCSQNKDTNEAFGIKCKGKRHIGRPWAMWFRQTLESEREERQKRLEIIGPSHLTSNVPNIHRNTYCEILYSEGTGLVWFCWRTVWTYIVYFQSCEHWRSRNKFLPHRKHSISVVTTSPLWCIGEKNGC